ncbi:hypothetical protein H6G89_32000 [Oscillatoria sp. FACHB-1407]|uniref:hypothetical protein n=1 Tax=Oscillatoria sp. FACHB-1407 TaxID=2692847 RepID=UPI0016823AFC|nr:hypothetical protein [Oscillatoria sp. FACHB-1407]MBD2465617.1 hypothetical protein [Oscillatoria sp. FACHB-1407]
MNSRNSQATKQQSSAVNLALPSPLFINFSTGGKGGVGKSFFVRLLYQYYLDQGFPVEGFEGDVRTPDFAGIYQEIRKAGNGIHFSEDENQATAPNMILNTVIKRKVNAVVNLPAAVDLAFEKWLEVSPVLDLSQANGIQLVKWFVVTGEYDSAQCLHVSLKLFGHLIPHVIVKNRKLKDWSYFDSDQDTQALIREHNCKVIDLPSLNVLIAGTILRKRLRYDEALSYQGENYEVTEQSTVRSLLRSTYQAIESTGFVPNSNVVISGSGNGKSN